jgi:hypothetical protein
VQVNWKRVYRVCREEGLTVQRRRRKRIAVPRQPMPIPRVPNERRSMHFVHDIPHGDQRIRLNCRSSAPYPISAILDSLLFSAGTVQSRVGLELEW